jgi:hypothetical protein
MFPVGTAGHDASVITGFVKRWWTPVHFAIMTANELMATLLPAAAAAGAATLVGWQGAEQMIPRIKAINATAESLGPAYGITSGQYLGTGSAIQQYQNRATGGVYELGGAGINLMRAGAGTFGQTGLSTISMLDRGVADMQLNMQQRGTMAELGGLAGKGTGYLRQLGDIGANFGNIFLGLAPHLPGVGEDYLSALEGITGGLGGGIGFMNQHGMGDVLGAGMAAEAGWRLGKPVVGLAGRGISGLGGLLGRGIGGVGGALAERAPLGSGLESLGFRLSGFGGALGAGAGGVGDFLGMLGGPEVAATALMAYGFGKLVTDKTPAQQQMARWQTGITQAGFSAGFTPLAHAITGSTGLAATSQGTPGVGTPHHLPGGRVAIGIQAAQALGAPNVYSAAAGGFEQTMGNLVNSGPQLVAALHKAGLKSVSMADAFQIAQNGLLDLTHAFDGHGHLTKQATQMLANYVSAIGPMTRSGGGFNAAIAAQQIMSSPAMKNLAGVNQAMDSMTQVMTGGPAGMATLFGMLGGTPTTVSHGGMKLHAPPAITSMAKALGSFTTAGGASAWNTFAGSQGLVTAEQQNLDQLRTYMTLGSLGLQGKTGAQGIAGFQLQQLLPMAKQSPAALAMLMQQGQQMGIGGYYDPSKTQGQNFAAEQKALASMAGSAQQVNKGMNAAVIASSNLPKTAMQFTQGLNANVMSQQIAQAARAVEQIRTAAGKGLIDHGALNQLVGSLKQAGIQGGAALHNSLDAVLKQAGVSKPMRVKIEGQYLPPHIPKPPSQSFTINGHVNMPPIPHVPNQSFTITGHVVMVGGQVSPYTPAGARANLGPAAYFHPAAAGVNPSAYTHLQTGGLVPGSGHGDIIPSMLEPGEAIVPRNLVPLVAPILALHNVPGFGGTPKGASTHFAAGGLVPHMLGFPDPTRMSGNMGQHVAWTLVDGITKALNQAGAGKIAQALVSKISQEVAYAKSVSSQAQQGLNLGGMDVTQGSVTDQMQSYLGSVKSFTGDIGTLRKQHLNKNLMQQLIAAGPVQGDALAQSILQGGGTSGKSGVGQVNQLWAQIGKASNALGAQAAMSKYGGHLSDDLKHAGGSQSHVSISVNVGSGSGGLDLTQAQIKSIVAQVQAALLKQAKRNPKTGLQLKGKGA